VIGAVLLVGCLLAADPMPADVASQAEVRKAVKELDGKRVAVRDAAESRLIELGPRVLDFLPDVGDPALTAEARERVKRIREQLQQAAAEAATQASLVTLRCQAMPVSKVLAELERQTGNNIIDPRRSIAAAGDPPITLSLEKKPFWSALDAVLDQARLSVYPFGPADAVQVIARPVGQLPRSGRAALAGPFRIEPTRVVARRDLRTPTSIVMVALEVAWEPRLRPIGLKQRMAEVAAEDQEGRPLRVEDAESEPEAFPRRDATAVEMDLVFAHPERSATEIAKLKGSVQAILPGRTETFRFANLLEGGKQQLRIAAATVFLEEVRRTPTNWEVHLRLRYDNAGDAMESHRTWAIFSKPWLEDAEGRRTECDSVEIGDRAKNEVGLVCSFTLKQPPANMTLVYKAPASIVTNDFRYELRSIKLP
jgi:hypothetical protein